MTVTQTGTPAHRFDRIHLNRVAINHEYIAILMAVEELRVQIGMVFIVKLMAIP